MNFADQLIAGIKQKKTPLVVGLDPRLEQLPKPFRDQVAVDSPDFYSQAATAFLDFSIGVIDVVATRVSAVKLQMAFFEQLGPFGMLALRHVIRHAQNRQLIVILDGKRNDIGSTAEAYAAAYLGREGRSAWSADALTVNPWMGRDSLAPFVTVATKNDAGLFVLVRTSNPGSEDYQALRSNSRSVYEIVAADVEELAVKTLGSGTYGSVGAVVGATYPDQLAELRHKMPHSLFLIPGFGAQGGRASDVAPAFDSRGLGSIVNSSRAIIFAHTSPKFKHLSDRKWQQAVEAATVDSIEQLRSDTPAGKL